MAAKSLFTFGFLLILCRLGITGKAPNIVFILTDDQDIVLGGTTPIVKAKKLIGDEGITFNNMFVTSPLCCPSRSSILTGHYVHNHGALNNSVTGNCSSPSWQQNLETKAFPVYLKKLGYTTFFAGKYLNQYGKAKAGGVKHVPPGWDHWIGLKGNSVYYNYTLSVNGKEEKHGDNYKDDYLTDIINRRATDFLNSQRPHILDHPFFMMLSTPACHAPFTPAPQYQANFSTEKAPRTPSFNTYAKDKHWLLRAAPHPMSNATIKRVDDVHNNRWRTLLSVDDMVENVYNILKSKGLLDNTYIIYSADNGYHLGQFSLPVDKRQLYEFDIRVPLMVRGPGITPGQKRNEIIANIDFAPTFVHLAGGNPPSDMDGTSFKNILLTNTSSKWRTDLLIEHTGEYEEIEKGCPQWNHKGMGNCDATVGCTCEDSRNNTYSCVRSITDKMNLMYCQFADADDFVEVYDLSSDPHQVKNIASTIDKEILIQQNKRLVKLSICSGPECRQPIDPWPPIEEDLRFEPQGEGIGFETDQGYGFIGVENMDQNIEEYEVRFL